MGFSETGDYTKEEGKNLYFFSFWLISEILYKTGTQTQNLWTERETK